MGSLGANPPFWVLIFGAQAGFEPTTRCRTDFGGLTAGTLPVELRGNFFIIKHRLNKLVDVENTDFVKAMSERDFNHPGEETM